jgi:hypothetical protein
MTESWNDLENRTCENGNIIDAASNILIFHLLVNHMFPMPIGGWDLFQIFRCSVVDSEYLRSGIVLVHVYSE